MKIHCNKCQLAITNSLYPKKKFNRKVTVEMAYPYTEEGLKIEEEGIESKDVKCSVPTGAFVKTVFRGWDDELLESVVCIDRESLLIPYPVYKSGMGCCDVDGVDVHCTCGELLGEMRYDCWQTYNCVSLDINKVELRNVSE